MKTFSIQYLEYLWSPEWYELKRTILELRGETCNLCGKTTRSLEGHHLNYKRFKHEELHDVLLVCSSCHSIITKEKDFRQAVNEFDSLSMKIYSISCRQLRIATSLYEEVHRTGRFREPLLILLEGLAQVIQQSVLRLGEVIDALPPGGFLDADDFTTD